MKRPAPAPAASASRPSRSVRLIPVLCLALAALGGTGCKAPRRQPTEAAVDAAIREKLALHREVQMQRLHAYAVAGQFPKNLTAPSNLHMFRDAEGHYCAVANLVHQDGRDDLVEATVRDRNGLAIHDVHDGPLMAWILDSGFTQEELERIQLPAPPMAHHDRAPGPRRPTPVDDVAGKAKAAPLVQVAVHPTSAPVVTEEQMEGIVRAHLAQVEAELRAHADTSLAVAVKRMHGGAMPSKLASR